MIITPHPHMHLSRNQCHSRIFEMVCIVWLSSTSLAHNMEQSFPCMISTWWKYQRSKNANLNISTDNVIQIYIIHTTLKNKTNNWLVGFLHADICSSYIYEMYPQKYQTKIGIIAPLQDLGQKHCLDYKMKKDVFEMAMVSTSMYFVWFT